MFHDGTPLAADVVIHDFEACQASIVIGPSLAGVFLTAANGPFGPGIPGHLDDNGHPTCDPDRATALVGEYEKDAGRALELTFPTAHRRRRRGYALS